jgi:hypothetical protein
MPELTPEQIAELERLEKAATPMPWDGDGVGVNDFGREYPQSLSMEWIPNDDYPLSDEDGRLIAALRNSAPYLIEAAKENARLRAIIDVHAVRDERIAMVIASLQVLRRVFDAEYSHSCESAFQTWGMHIAAAISGLQAPLEAKHAE